MEQLRSSGPEQLSRTGTSGFGTRLQDLVESASSELNRPVAVDDRHFRLLAHTEHRDTEVDSVRLASVLTRGVPDRVAAWLEAQGVQHAHGPVVVPANAALGMDARVCVPIRCHDYLLGYLWLIDREMTLGAPELAHAGAVADAAGVVMYRELLLRDFDRSRERELLRDLLSDDERVRRDAVVELVDLELFATDGPVTVVVALLPPAFEGRSAEALRAAIDAALMRVRRHVTPKHALHLIRPDHVLLLVALGDPSVRAHGPRQLAERLRDELSDLSPVVALGGTARELGEALRSYREALRAARVARAMEGFGDVASWDELGIYGLLAELPVERLNASMLHPGLRELIENPRAHVLVQTLERYLDNAGDAQATARSLHLHRTSLYHRLRRIEELAHVDLRSGDDRLALHLGLKLARLLGLEWSGEHDEPGPADAATSASA